MRKNVVILEKSFLAQNVYLMILKDLDLQIEVGFHIEDLDVFSREGKIDLLILSATLFENERLSSALARNIKLKNIPKIFLADSKSAPTDFQILQRPFHPDAFLKMVKEALK